jgi:FixJ family two-component response regulator
MLSRSRDVLTHRPLLAAEAQPIVFVVDDDDSMRESLEALIEYAGWQPETFGSGEEFLRHTPTRRASCLLLDYTLPTLNGLQIQQRVAEERPDMPIIFITGHGDVPITVQAMKAGAVEFLIKPFKTEVLLDAIRNAIQRSRVALQQDRRRRDIGARYASLSPRERQVMDLVVRGLLNKQVAAQLSISEITVKAHRGHMMKKMGAASLAALVTIAAHCGANSQTG